LTYIVKKITISVGDFDAGMGLFMDFSLTIYYPIFLFLIATLLFAVSALVACHMIGPRKKTPVKDMTYESGMDPIGDARQRFDVKFYLLAILFLVFDVELLFLYPWAVAAGPGNILPDGFRHFVFWEVIVFLVTVTIAYIYAWRKGVFKWR
jgi:NADH-quinone oxidoreductase subunit A